MFLNPGYTNDNDPSKVKSTFNVPRRSTVVLYQLQPDTAILYSIQVYILEAYSNQEKKTRVYGYPPPHLHMLQVLLAELGDLLLDLGREHRIVPLSALRRHRRRRCERGLFGHEGVQTGGR